LNVSKDHPGQNLMDAQCLADDVAHALATGQLTGLAARAAHGHLDACERCRRWVSELARAETPSVPVATHTTVQQSTQRFGDTTAGIHPALPQAELAAGTVLGTYEIRRKVGSGGMSVVYAARDQHLGRDVALKVLRPGDTSLSMKARMLREAQAMARLSHPNVLPLYEAREHEGTLFIAMELVEGTTLGRWLWAARRSWPEVLRVFRDAAAGLAAAHAAGIVHRDFKPENVLIGNDGRVRVTDFGLARWSGESGPENDLSLTRSGTFVGTPVYMSPEHASTSETDARSDQFSFCVALYEGLFGRRPFTGANVAELARAMRHQVIERPTRRTGVPSGVKRHVLKGLSPAPENRHASMTALSTALVRAEQAHARRRVVAQVAFAATLVVAVAFGWRAWTLPPPPAREFPVLQQADAKRVIEPSAPVVVEPPRPAAAKAATRSAPPARHAMTLDTQSPYAQ
jgi:aminoglycoside phosphotransferase (APT) family kinase protein